MLFFLPCRQQAELEDRQTGFSLFHCTLNASFQGAKRILTYNIAKQLFEYWSFKTELLGLRCSQAEQGFNSFPVTHCRFLRAGAAVLGVTTVCPASGKESEAKEVFSKQVSIELEQGKNANTFASA